MKVDRDDRQLLGEIGIARDDGAGEDTRIGGQIMMVLARRRLAIAGHVGLEKLALRVGVALQRVELNLLLARLAGLRLQLVEFMRQVSLAATGDVGRILEALRAPCAPLA